MQADMAQEVANRLEFPWLEEEVAEAIERASRLRDAEVEAIALAHNQAITDAAQALVKAELLHRELVRRR